MLSKIQFNNQNYTQSSKNTVIPPINRFHKAASDSVSFGTNLTKIESPLQAEFATVYKKVLMIMRDNPEMKSIKNYFGHGRKIIISPKYTAQNPEIVCDVVEMTKATASGIRYTVKESGRVRKQEISDYATELKSSFNLIGQKPLLENKKEAKKVLEALNSIVDKKLLELEELSDVPKLPRPSTLDSVEVSEVKAAAPKLPRKKATAVSNTQVEPQQKSQSKSSLLQNFINIFKKLLG